MPAIALRTEQYTTAAELRGRYAAVRSALREPDNAVTDLGIDLRRPKPSPHICIGDDTYAAFLIDIQRRPSPRDLLGNSGKKFRLVRHVVADHYDLEPEDLTGPGRSAHLIEPRHVAIFILRRSFGYSTPQTGRFFNRDHSTILYSIRKTDRRMQADSGFRQKVANLMRACRGEG